MHGTCHSAHLGVSISSFSVKGCNKSWEAHERNQQFGENESIDNGNSPRCRKDSNARIWKVLAMRVGFMKIIEKVHSSTNCEFPDTDTHIAVNA